MSAARKECESKDGIPTLYLHGVFQEYSMSIKLYLKGHFSV